MRFLVRLRFFLSLCLSVSSICLPCSLEDEIVSENWRSKLSCGAVCAAYMLKFHGHSLDSFGGFVGIRKRLVSGTRGAEIGDIASFLEEAGLSCGIKKIGPDDLQQLVLPAIVHVTLNSAGAENTGHFVVITKIEGVDVSFFDGTKSKSGLVVLEFETFIDIWSGYVIETDHPVNFYLVRLVFSLLFCFSLICVVRWCTIGFS